MARRWIDQSAEEAGGIDVLYNNASACRFVPFEAMPVDDWRWSMRNELDLVFYATRFAWPYLQRKGGVVINIASVAGMAGSGPGGAAHAARSEERRVGKGCVSTCRSRGARVHKKKKTDKKKRHN